MNTEIKITNAAQMHEKLHLISMP